MENTIKVVKFGGSSLANAAQFKKVKAILDADSSRRYIVPSAPGKRNPSDEKVTDLLYALYDEKENVESIFSKIKKRFDDIISDLELDLDLSKEYEAILTNLQLGYPKAYAASRGEYLNGLILSSYLQVPFIDAARVICFDRMGNFLPEQTNEKLKKCLVHYPKAIIPGFYGGTFDGTIVTFSRGGSDITGSLVARAMQAKLYENWTDVSGFLLADPRIVENPLPIRMITYKELYELSSMGASVLHEEAVFPVKKAGIPIQIKNTNRPDDLGTLIVEDIMEQSNYKITGIAGKKGYFKIKLSDEHLLQFVEDHHMPCDSYTSSVLMQQNHMQSTLHPHLQQLDHNIALIAVGGRDFQTKRSFSRRICRTLNAANISVKALSQGQEELTMLVGVRDEDFEQAVRVIYDYFIDVKS